jgi:hypothetical protein
MSSYRKSGDRSISRRDFVRKSALGALSIPLFAQDYGRLFAQSADKPVLTIASLNAFFQKVQGQGPSALERLLSGAQQNLEPLLTSNFTLNPKQLEAFRTALSERRLKFEEFFTSGLSQVRLRQTIAPLRAEFDPKVSPYVRIFGFGKEIFTCKNENLGALTLTPQKTPTANCVKQCAHLFNCCQ